MKSNVCTLKGIEPNLKEVLAEVEKVAAYNGLAKKQALQLSLLSEELIGIQKGILGFVEGSFYIENTGNVYKLCLHADINTDVLTQERFVEMSTRNANEATRGIMAKIKYVVNYLMSGNSAALPDYDLFNSQSSYHCYATPTAYDKVWSLGGYKDGLSKENEVWDEMERSIVANIADDLIVGATANYVELTAVKKFD